MRRGQSAAAVRCPPSPSLNREPPCPCSWPRASRPAEQAGRPPARPDAHGHRAGRPLHAPVRLSAAGSHGADHGDGDRAGDAWIMTIIGEPATCTTSPTSSRPSSAMAEHAHTIPAPLGAAGTRPTGQRFAAHEEFGEYARLRRDALLRIQATWPGIDLRTELWRARKAEAGRASAPGRPLGPSASLRAPRRAPSTEHWRSSVRNRRPQRPRPDTHRAAPGRARTGVGGCPDCRFTFTRGVRLWSSPGRLVIHRTASEAGRPLNCPAVVQTASMDDRLAPGGAEISRPGTTAEARKGNPLAGLGRLTRQGWAGMGRKRATPTGPHRMYLAGLVAALSRYSRGPRRKKRDQIAANTLAPRMYVSTGTQDFVVPAPEAGHADCARKWPT